MAKPLLKAAPLALATLLLAVLATIQCSVAPLPHCRVKCGAFTPSCPTDMSCGQDGYCYHGGEAQTCNPWFTAGPWNGLALAVAPGSANRLLAGGRSTAIGLYSSVDGGERWTSTFKDVYVYAVLYDPMDPAFAIAGTSGGLMRVPLDSTPRTMLISQAVKALAVDGANVLYAGTGGTHTVFRRNPDGTFAPLGALPSSVTDINVIAFSTASPPTMFVGTDRGFYRTIDAGANWTPLGQGIPNASNVDAIAVDPANPNVLTVGTEGGLFRSTDGGGSFVALTNGLPMPLAGRALALDGSGILYVGTDAGLFRSTDGTRFSPVALPGTPNVGAIVLVPSQPGTAYVGTDAGVFKTTLPNMAAWVRVTTGLEIAADVAGLALSTTGRYLYAATTQGAYRASVADRRWSRSFSSAAAQSVVVDPGDTLYIGTANVGIYQIPQTGSSRFVNSGLPCVAGTYYDDCLAISALAIDPDDPRVFYAGTRAGSKGLRDGGLYRSGDAGGTWTAVNTAPQLGVNAFARGRGGTRAAYLGTTVGAFKSDDGMNWQPMSTGLATQNVTAVAVLADGTAFAGTSGALYRAAPGAPSWSVVPGGPPNVVALAVDPANPAVLYTASDAGMSKTSDGGATFTPVHTGRVRSLLVDPAASRTVYAGSDTGVLVTTSGGLP